MVLEGLQSNLPARQIASLKVCSRWKREFSFADVKVLLESPSRDVRLTALRYLQALGDAKYLALVAPLLSDPDEAVADEARRTSELLKSKAQS